ncbi:MAG: hypothetical protein HN657_03745 [Candidatus Marinimicrobia bacterium]|jgi:hypothetical protein|nr:hypothetical protein [Candidatus Neomarinimicrobiota bacterium]MBT3496504.1 hypothetical protein [Candidatus Neomarinimicrobiota bacterium]MBT3692294.1 hypothetical protein [Candidatus Neomarinimicrobiota bacterium]MBT3732661.1 hypothetical protein [Candidatus Neomarinimicrobiota bacterium]MBT4143841.1 hypothetical protein [Candidatus Neomarinimicrobiota bacterium]
MLIARLMPPESSSFKKGAEFVKKYDNCIASKVPLQLFGLWSLFFAGLSFGAGNIDRYAYWDGSGYLLEGLGLFLLTAIYMLVLRPKKIINLSLPIQNRLHRFKFILFTLIVFLIGFTLKSKAMIQADSLMGISPYLFSILGGALIFNIPIQLNEETGKWDVSNWENKSSVLISSSILIGLGTLLAFVLDDPIMSTVSMIALPFSVIALVFPSHIRHIQRLRFFPLFIFLMFLAVRLPWILFPLAVLFFLLRTFYYFRYGIIYPSFGVDHDEEI